MIPILYDENETQFVTNGIGRLTDAISCLVTWENGGVYELALKYPADGIHADEITANRIIFAEPEMDREPQPFVIRDVDKTLRDQIRVTARHVAYDLSYYACAEFGQTKTVPYDITPELYSSERVEIGPLDDATFFNVALESSLWVLTMQYPAAGELAAEITPGGYVYAQPAIGRDLQMFLITAVTTADGELSVTAQANVVPDVEREYNEMTVSQALAYIEYYANEIQPFPFELQAQPESPGDEWATQLRQFWSEAPTSVRELISEDQERIVDTFGGEWEYDRFRCVLHESRGTDNGVSYRYGKNITDISERINIDELFTHAFSYWKGTESSSTNTQEGQYFVKRGSIIKALDDQYDEMFPQQRTYIIDASSQFEQEPTIEELDAYTTQYIQNNKVGVPTVTINVNVVDLAATEDYADIRELETVHQCDTVSVVFPRFGVDIKQKVSKIVYNVLLGKNDAVTIGQTDVNLSDIIAQNQRDIVRNKYELQKWSDKCAERANRAICGWYGGNIRRNYAETDHKQQSMYIMNADDMDAATHSIKADGQGLSVSVNGAQGTYKPLIDISGAGAGISDRWATRGDMNASFVKRGILTDGESTWDIDRQRVDLTGTFHGTVDGIDVADLERRVTNLGG